MADQKRWFKVWVTLLIDMDNLSDELIGQWTRLGCRIAAVGTNGTVTFDTWDHLARFLRVTVDRAHGVFIALPSIEIVESKNRDGRVSVTMKNWHKYQEDSTAASRMRALRSKKRGEEKRREVPLTPPASRVGFNQFKGLYPRKEKWPDAEKAWRQVGAEPHLVAILEDVTRRRASEAWLEAKFIPLPASYLRGRRWEDTPLTGTGAVDEDPYAGWPHAWECPTCGGVHEGPRDGPRTACSAAPRAVASVASARSQP
jgi:hypothetical protein